MPSSKERPPQIVSGFDAVAYIHTQSHGFVPRTSASVLVLGDVVGKLPVSERAEHPDLSISLAGPRRQSGSTESPTPTKRQILGHSPSTARRRGSGGSAEHLRKRPARDVSRLLTPDAYEVYQRIRSRRQRCHGIAAKRVVSCCTRIRSAPTVS